MSNTREKLIKLLDEASGKIKELCSGLNDHNGNGVRADYLISHGATVQEWISVKDRLPENDYGKHWKERKYYLVQLAPSGLMFVAHYGYKEYGWWIDGHDCVLSATNFKEVTHWTEITNMPQPPKEE